MKQAFFNRQRSNNSAIPDAIFILLIANCVLFAVQNLSWQFMLLNFALWPATVEGSPFGIWQLLSYGFLHGNLTHLLFNMFGLWMFGSDLERLWGPRHFVEFYLVCVVGAGIVQLLVAALQGGLYPTVGASGGLYGVLLAFGLTFPNRIIMPLFPPIPMRAIVAVGVFAAFELFSGISGARPGVANFAHLGGMLVGFLMLRFWSRARRP